MNFYNMNIRKKKLHKKTLEKKWSSVMDKARKTHRSREEEEGRGGNWMVMIRVWARFWR